MILRELTGHTRHRRIAVDLLILQALDWDEGELTCAVAILLGGKGTTFTVLDGGKPVEL